MAVAMGKRAARSSSVIEDDRRMTRIPELAMDHRAPFHNCWLLAKGMRRLSGALGERTPGVYSLVSSVRLIQFGFLSFPFPFSVGVPGLPPFISAY
jgi:hypothetical protein